VTEALPSPRGMERNVQQLTCQSSRPCPCQHSPSQRPSRWCQPPSQRRPGSVSPTPSAIPSIPQPVLVASQQAPAQASGQPAPSDTAKSRTGLCGPEWSGGQLPIRTPRAIRAQAGRSGGGRWRARQRVWTRGS